MTASFGAQSTTDEVLAGQDLSGQRILVTGVSAGLGVETARTLKAHGAEVVGTARDLAKAEAALTAAGMSNLHVLDGGIAAWIAAGLPVRRGVPRMSLERQVRIAAGTLAAAGGFLALFVNPLFAAVPAFVGTGLVFAGITDTCAMGMCIAKLPYNKPASCDVPEMVRALCSHSA